MFRESGWHVGLNSISLPASRLNLTPLQKDDALLIRFTWWETADDEVDLMDHRTLNLDVNYLMENDNILSGVDLIRFCTDMYEKVINVVTVGQTMMKDEENLFVEFRWAENDELSIDNTRTYREHQRGSPRIQFGERLAVAMGWLVLDSEKKYKLESNLRKVHDIKVILAEDISSDPDSNEFSKCDGKYLTLSVFCNWNFTNLNKAFRKAVGCSNRSMHVYSDVGSSTIVGNQVTDLLREIEYKGADKGTVYFEPLHVEYHPVRNEVVETIETQVSYDRDASLHPKTMNDFIVTLPSHSNKREFPANEANHFKIRLAHPLHLPGSGWKVGLSSISLPDSKVNIYHLAEKGKYVFSAVWIKRVDGLDYQGSGACLVNDLQKLDSIVDGVCFMKAMINSFVTEGFRRVNVEFTNAWELGKYRGFRIEHFTGACGIRRGTGI
ncbi:hypothetical protein OS493_023681 [Desmophyllum pertusum]|uniref:Uncharacterized protein n=1 Tax=Desmophyllum pertusum TaxID=174260 RepID=A0A9W9YYF5_9CNID|nr:hypothetical protein OS493_023681 [Desmophyllum pertusum]